jgi:Mrp family chromosome partitioning ATPase
MLGSGEVPENPAELLASRKMKQFLSEVRAQFDFDLGFCQSLKPELLL